MTQLVKSLGAARAISIYAKWHNARLTRKALYAMSLRELDDIGIAPYQIKDIR